MEKDQVDNGIYDQLGEKWYTAFDNPVALLRQESLVKTPWVKARIRKHFSGNIKLLDVGCGAGFLSNALVDPLTEVHGIDLSDDSLRVAKIYDRSNSVVYSRANASQLPYPDQFFDAITAMDFLEHVENPQEVILEISRVLKPGGLFFFHTFNRNFLAKAVIIKAVEYLVKNTPKNMHVIELFITPEELKAYCENSNMKVLETTGIRPRFSTITLKSLLTRTVPTGFGFQLTPSLKLSYMGYAQKANF